MTRAEWIEKMSIAARCDSMELKRQDCQELLELLREPTYTNIDVLDIQSLVQEAHATAVEKGWWPEDQNVPEKFAMIHAEVSEALEVFRRPERPYADKFLVEEFADICIRVFDLAGAFKFDLGKAIEAKMEKNRGRPHRHGDLPF